MRLGFIVIIGIVVFFQMRRLMRFWQQREAQKTYESADRPADPQAGIQVAEAMAAGDVFVAKCRPRSPFFFVLFPLAGALIGFLAWFKFGLEREGSVDVGLAAVAILWGAHLLWGRNGQAREIRIYFGRAEIEFCHFTFFRTLIGNPTPASLVLPFASVISMGVSKQYHREFVHLTTSEGRTAFSDDLEPFGELVSLLGDIQELNRATPGYGQVAAAAPRRLTLLEMVLLLLVIAGGLAWIWWSMVNH